MDILESLRGDPGQKTIGQLIQERERAFNEIVQLRKELNATYKSKIIRESAKTYATLPQQSPDSRPRAFRLGSLIRLSEVCEFVGLSRSSIYNRLGEGNFPVPVQVGARAVRWRVEDVEAWCTHRQSTKRNSALISK